MSSTIQIRINKDVKNRTKKVFNELGIDVSSGIKLFLAQVVNTGSIPFNPVTQNGFSVFKEKEIIKETQKIIKSGKRYKNIQEAHSDISRMSCKR